VLHDLAAPLEGTRRQLVQQCQHRTLGGHQVHRPTGQGGTIVQLDAPLYIALPRLPDHDLLSAGWIRTTSGDDIDLNRVVQLEDIYRSGHTTFGNRPGHPLVQWLHGDGVKPIERQAFFEIHEGPHYLIPSLQVQDLGGLVLDVPSLAHDRQ